MTVTGVGGYIQTILNLQLSCPHHRGHELIFRHFGGTQNLIQNLLTEFSTIFGGTQKKQFRGFPFLTYALFGLVSSYANDPHTEEIIYSCNLEVGKSIYHGVPEVLCKCMTVCMNEYDNIIYNYL